MSINKGYCQLRLTPNMIFISLVNSLVSRVVTVDGLQSKQEQHIYNVVEESPQYEVIRVRTAGGAKDVPPAQEIPLKNCPAYVPSAVPGRSGNSGEDGGLYETISSA